jgi:hypothetical protein
MGDGAESKTPGRSYKDHDPSPDTDMSTDTPSTNGDNPRNLYAVHRMDLAAERLMQVRTADEIVNAGKWIVLWGAAAGARLAGAAACAGTGAHGALSTLSGSARSGVV